MKPIRVFWSALDERFYASRAWRVVKRTDATEHIEITGQKFDVTQDICVAVVRNQIEFREATTEPVEDA